MSDRTPAHADKTANPLSSPQAQEKRPLPAGEAPLERPSPTTEAVDKVITPTSIKNKERDTEALEKAEQQVERQLHKSS